MQNKISKYLIRLISRDIFRHNIGKFNTVEECNRYLNKKSHKLRTNIVIELLHEVINKEQNSSKKLLSIACSTGIIEEKIKNAFGIDVYGVDAAKHSLEEANKHGVIAKYADVSKRLPFEDAYFDFVFAGEIIEHLLNTKFFLSEVNRVLKPKGYLILTTPNLGRFDDRLRLLFGKAPRQISPMHDYLYLHIRPFTFDSLKNALTLCGFTDIKLRTNFFAIEFFGKEIKIYSPLLTRLFPSFGSTLIVRSRKESIS